MIMAHYAFLNDDNTVTEVIVGRDESEGDWETFYSQERNQRCVRTSYNGRIRGRYAGIGYKYDETLDVFIAPQPFPSWTHDSTGEWHPPIARPNGDWYWHEETLSWVEVTE